MAELEEEAMIAASTLMRTKSDGGGALFFICFGAAHLSG